MYKCPANFYAVILSRFGALVIVVCLVYSEFWRNEAMATRTSVRAVAKRRGTLRSQVLQTYSELPHKNLQDTCTRQGVLFATLFMLCMRVCAEL